MSRPEATHVYIARKTCGCVTAVVTDCGDKHTAADVKDFIMTGRTVERMAIDVFKADVRLGCKCPPPTPIGEPVDASLFAEEGE